MFNRDIDLQTALRAAAFTLLAFLLFTLPATPAALAQDQAPDEATGETAVADEAQADREPIAEAEPEAEPPEPLDQADRALRERIEGAYEVLPVRDGILLRPREEYRGVQTVEIADDRVAINGESMPHEAVRGWLGERADDVQALAELEVTERRALFGLTTEPPQAAETAAAAAGPAGGEAAAPEVPEPPEPVEPEAPEAPREPRYRRGGQTGFGSNVLVAEDEIVEDVVVLGGSVTVDGKVDGDAVVVGGRLEINGEVDKDAAVIGGSMHLGPRSVVGGDVAVVGGTLHREPGSVIRGSIERVERSWQVWPWGGPWLWNGEWDRGWNRWSPWNDVGELFWSLGGLILWALLIAIVLAIGRGGIERLSDRIGLEPVKAGVVGLLVAVLLVPVLIVVSMLLIISIIGIPIFVILLLAFIFLGVPALMIIGLVGYTAVSHRVGVWLGRRFGWSLESPFAAAFVGLLGLSALTLIGRFLDLFGGPVHLFAAMFLLAGCGVQLVAGCVGFGAVFLHLWTRRSGGPQAGATGTLPPAPPSPGESPVAGSGASAEPRPESEAEFHPPEEQATSQEEEPPEEEVEGDDEPESK